MCGAIFYVAQLTLTAAKTSLAVIVCLRFSLAKSLAQAVKYKIKIPADRAKAAEASLPTLVDAGSVFFRIRRTHASGGSNSTAVGSAPGSCGVPESLLVAGDMMMLCAVVDQEV
jgi:hypothetical protein